MNPSGNTVGSITYDARIDTTQLKVDAATADAIVQNVGDSIGNAIEAGGTKAVTALNNLGSSITNIGNQAISGGRNINQMGSQVSNLGSLMTRAAEIPVIALSAGFGLVGKMAFDQVNAVQQATLALRAYEKDGTKVDAVLSGLLSYARSDLGVLFNRKDLFAAAQGLKVMGDSTDHLTNHVEIMSRAVGLGTSTWDNLSEIVGRVGSTGRLTGIDFDNLTKAGYRLDPALRNTNISFDALFTAMDKGIPVDALAGQADSIKGIGVRLQTAFRGIGESILGVNKDTGQFIQGGAGDQLVQFLKGLPALLKDPKIQESFSNIGKALASFAKDALPKLITFIEFFAEHIGVITKIAFEVLAFGVAMKVVGGVMKAVGTAVELVGYAIKGVGLVVKGVGLVVELAKWGAQAAVTAAKFTAQFAIMSAKAVATGVKVAAQAVVGGAAWVAQATVASAKWVASFAVMVAKATPSALVMAAKAADVGTAWVINAARVSFVWVTTELPKLVLGFITTAASATLQAGITSAAWIANAVKTSVSWVITELPKIVAGFVVTTASAVLQAALSSAAWIAAAVATSTSWVITELPKIVIGFVALSASAVVNAAIASAAWIAAAVASSAAWIANIATTSATYGALSALIATPMVMPALVVAAAIASIVLVYNKIQETQALLDKLNTETVAENAGSTKAMQEVADAYHQGKISKEQYQRFFQSISQRASGGPVAANQPYIVGEKRPELFVPSTSGTIIPELPSGGGQNVSIKVNMSGIMARSRSDLREVARDLVKTLNDELSAKNVALIGGGNL